MDDSGTPVKNVMLNVVALTVVVETLENVAVNVVAGRLTLSVVFVIPVNAELDAVAGLVAHAVSVTVIVWEM